jgi:hypothetical protein
MLHRQQPLGIVGCHSGRHRRRDGARYENDFRTSHPFHLSNRKPIAGHFGCEDHFDVVDTLRIEPVPVQIRLSA